MLTRIKSVMRLYRVHVQAMYSVSFTYTSFLCHFALLYMINGFNIIFERIKNTIQFGFSCLIVLQIWGLCPELVQQLGQECGLGMGSIAVNSPGQAPVRERIQREGSACEVCTNREDSVFQSLYWCWLRPLTFRFLTESCILLSLILLALGRLPRQKWEQETELEVVQKTDNL